MDDEDRAERLRRQAEEAMGRKGPVSKGEEELDARRLVHELRVHQVELELQNEELRETRARAEESLERFRELFEYAPVPYVSLDRKGTVLQANLAAGSALRVPRSRLVGRPFQHRLPSERRGEFLEFLGKTIDDGRQQPFETTLSDDCDRSLFARIVGLGSDRKPGECRLAIVDLSDREEARLAIERANADIKALMQELNHRVKNNFGVVMSLLGMGEMKVEDPRAKEILLDSRARVMALTQIYERLHLENEVLAIELSGYLEDLVSSLLSTYAVDASRIRLVTDFESMRLDARKAGLVGLVFSELISNATKYAYGEGEAGELRVSLARREGRIELAVADDGRGLPEGTDPSTGLGFSIARSLASQLGGRLSLGSGAGKGLEVRLDFPA
ncbi:MAG TPA: histidine kinase dimerization/phosphoacceptor domain -containing protein [Rectinemataceae bacterium]|nr:histidine kinase dimerization/phosphoacceptor domain -containing protein [Rectinemataceae bacterium]